MSMAGRWFSERDMKFINSINAELYGDVLQTEVVLFKACIENIKVNLYGESDPSVGQQYYPGINIVAIIDRGEIATEPSDFGTDRKQGVVFKFRQEMLKLINFFPQTGDLILFNARYHQIEDISVEQLLGGIPEKSLSVICNTHYSRLSAIDIVIRQN